jgi:hypothetical protein
MSAVLFRNVVLGKSIKPVYTWIVALTLLGLGSSIPYLIAFFLYYNQWHYLTDYFIWQVGNPFAALYDWSNRSGYLVFASIWAIIIAALNVPWFLRQVNRFRPPGSERPVTPNRTDASAEQQVTLGSP